jgi:flagellar hook-associated protein 2
VRATSSAPASVAVATQPGAAVGTLTFTVQQLASAASQISTGSLASRDAVATTGPVHLVKGSLAGVGGVVAGSSPVAGPHTVTVTQSSSAAVVTGTPLGGPVALSGAVLELQVAGDDVVLALDDGTYDADGLAAEVQRASGGTLTASVVDGALRLATVREGSAAVLTATGGTALAELGLTAGATATGTDATVRLGSGADVVVADVRTGESVDLGAVALQLSGGLRAGSAEVTALATTGTTTLAQLAEAVTTARAGVTASVVEVAPGAHRLQLTSTATGAAGAVQLGGALVGALGGWSVVTEGRDAVLRVGDGPGAYDVVRPTNTVTGVVAGLTLTLSKADPAAPVTVTTARDTAAAADSVKALVDGVNSVLSRIATLTRYDTETRKAGPLSGDGMLRRISAELVRSLTAEVAGAGLGSASSTGITVARDGSLSFDRARFVEQYEKDPAAVQALLGAGTDAQPGVGARLRDVASQMSRAGDGLLPAAVRAREQQVAGFTDRISAWDQRLALRETALKRQFTAMERALGSLQQQSTWLSGQLAGLFANSTR